MVLFLSIHIHVERAGLGRTGLGWAGLCCITLTECQMYSSSSALRLLRESIETGEKQNGAITTQEVVSFVGMECTYSPTRTRTVVSLELAHGHCNFASAVDRLLCGCATIFPLTKYIVLLILVAQTACLPSVCYGNQFYEA